MGALMLHEWIPIKGGDGGTAPRMRVVRGPGGRKTRHRMGGVHDRDNGSVYTQGVFADCEGAAMDEPVKVRAGVAYSVRLGDRRSLLCNFIASLSPADRAHLRKDGAGRLMPAVAAAMMPGAKPRPRRYHPSWITSRGHTYEEACDELYQRQKYLEGVAGLGYRSQAVANEIALRDLFSSGQGGRLKQRTHV